MGLGQLKQMFSAANLKEAAWAAAGGAGAGVVFDLLNEIDTTDAAGVKTPVFDKAWKRGLLAGGLAVVGGGAILAFKPSMKTAAHGWMGAMGAELGRMAMAAMKAAAAGAAAAPAGIDELALRRAMAGTSITSERWVGGSRIAGALGGTSQPRYITPREAAIAATF